MKETFDIIEKRSSHKTILFQDGNATENQNFRQVDLTALSGDQIFAYSH